MISKRHAYRTVTKAIAVSAHNANMELVLPSAEYKDSFIDAVKEFPTRKQASTNSDTG